MPKMYCTDCEEMVTVKKESTGELFHWSEQWFIGDDCEQVYCKGFFTTTPPPELPDNWEQKVTEPSPDELDRMNVAANDLLMDVIGAGL